jgi:hypothetical protein
MYGDPTPTADQIANWTSLGITLPSDLEKAVEVFETVKWIEVGYGPTFDLEKLTPKNAETEIRKLAEQLVMTEAQQDASGANLSMLDKAKRHVLKAAASQVIGLGRAAIPAVIEQLTPAFDKAAAEYTEAVSTLPDEITADRLVTGGPSVVSAYQAAQNAASYLNSVSLWVASTAAITGVLARDMEVVLRILRPENGIQLSKLEDAHQLQANAAITALNPVYVAAVRLGVPFGINTLREAAQLRKSLQLRPQLLRSGAVMTNA